jgi:hypothetical protein
MKSTIVPILFLALSSGDGVEAKKSKKGASSSSSSNQSSQFGGLSSSFIRSSLSFQASTNSKSKSSKSGSSKASDTDELSSTLFFSSTASTNGSPSKSSKGSSKKRQSQDESFALESVGGSSTVLNGQNVPADSALAGSRGAFGAFEWDFNTALSEMAYTIEVGGSPGTNPTRGAFVDGAALYCGSSSDASSDATKLADLQVDQQGDVTSARLSYNDLEGIECNGVLDVSTIAGLYDAMLLGEVFIEVEVAEVGGPTAIIRSPLNERDPNTGSGSGYSLATFANVLGDDKETKGDRSSFALLDLQFNDLLGTMEYTTASSDPDRCCFVFDTAGLYCGNGGDDDGALLATLQISDVGTAISSFLDSGNLETGATCGGDSIASITSLEEIIADGLVYYQVDTAGGEVRSQVYLT